MSSFVEKFKSWKVGLEAHLASVFSINFLKRLLDVEATLLSLCWGSVKATGLSLLRFNPPQDLKTLPHVGGVDQLHQGLAVGAEVAGTA